jgi:hypothetical protein
LESATRLLLGGNEWQVNDEAVLGSNQTRGWMKQIENAIDEETGSGRNPKIGGCVTLPAIQRRSFPRICCNANIYVIHTESHFTSIARLY